MMYLNTFNEMHEQHQKALPGSCLQLSTGPLLAQLSGSLAAFSGDEKAGKGRREQEHVVNKGEQSGLLGNGRGHQQAEI